MTQLAHTAAVSWCKARSMEPTPQALDMANRRLCRLGGLSVWACLHDLPWVVRVECHDKRTHALMDERQGAAFVWLEARDAQQYQERVGVLLALVRDHVQGEQRFGLVVIPRRATRADRWRARREWRRWRRELAG